MASVRDCSALADAQPVEVTNANMPWFISSQAGGRGKEQRETEWRKRGELFKVRSVIDYRNWNKHIREAQFIK